MKKKTPTRPQKRSGTADNKKCHNQNKKYLALTGGEGKDIKWATTLQ